MTSRRETTTSGTASSERPVDVRPPTRRERFLHWLPWEKGLIWALVLLAVYVLRSFFLVIFLTFILAYTMRSIVAWVAGVILPARENVWLERALTLCCFALLLFGLYLAGNYFGPRLVKQGEQLVGQLKYLDRSEFQGALRQAVGPFLFDRRYGSETNEEYRKAFQEFLENDPPLVVEEFEKFGETAARLRRDFEIRLEADSARGLQELTGARRAEAFEPWFLASKAPEIYARDEGGWLERWEADYRSMAAATAQYGSPSLEDLEKQEDFEEQREALVYRFILREFPKREEAAWKALQEEWEEAVRQSAVDQFKAAPARYERRFEAHYKELHESDKSAFPHAYPTFIRLRDAHAEGMEAFSKVLDELGLSPQTETERLEKAHRDFRSAKEKALVTDALSQPLVAEFTAGVGNFFVEKRSELVAWAFGGIKNFIFIPAQVALSLILSLFITIDIRRIRKGIALLEGSRVRDIYDEVAPGLADFGRLIGRAFQAQGVIAIFNTILTFAAIRFLGIQNEIFLCAIVFVCSFIPVLGVVLSSVPIAIMALVQPGGDIALALKIVVAILLIHFIETSLLNPKILGDMLHLHPVLVLTVLAVGEHFFGVWGLLLGVPVAVYVIRCVILDAGIPGLIERRPEAPPAPPGGGERTAAEREDRGAVVKAGAERAAAVESAGVGKAG